MQNAVQYDIHLEHTCPLKDYKSPPPPPRDSSIFTDMFCTIKEVHYFNNIKYSVSFLTKAEDLARLAPSVWSCNQWRIKRTGVKICPKSDIFAPPPISKNDIFSPSYSKNFPFFLDFPPLPLNICVFF